MTGEGVYETNPAGDLVAQGLPLPDIREAAEGCRACDLYRRATQTVFGVGAESARLFILGEQPGDVEDREGEPFVGPAGSVLRAALDEVGIPGEAVYITNLVKHFRWKSRGNKRLHQKPATRHIRACMPWLEAEVERTQPRVIVCLGATAAQALLGNDFRVTKDHGEPYEWEGRLVIATMHPSSVLRSADSAERQRRRRTLVEDLAAAWKISG